MFGLNCVYWSSLHPVSKNWLPFCPTQQLIFSGRLTSDIERCFSASVVSVSSIPTITESPTPVRSEFNNYNLIPLNVLFDDVKDTLSLCYLDKLLGVFMI